MAENSREFKITLGLMIPPQTLWEKQSTFGMMKMGVYGRQPHYPSVSPKSMKYAMDGAIQHFITIVMGSSRLNRIRPLGYH